MSNPWDNPYWTPLHRETKLVQQLIGNAVTALGKASYADGLGNYYTAFFGLSIGIERLAKLIIVCDYALENNDEFPDQKQLKKYGHNLIELCEAVQAIAKKRGLNPTYSFPSQGIHKAILKELDSFADAKKGRYDNFKVLKGVSTQSQFEPLTSWWSNVAETILKAHYYGKSTEKKVEANANAGEAMIGGFTSVLHFDELGHTMESWYVASRHTGKTEIVQKWSRFYTLEIVRGLASILKVLFFDAAYQQNKEQFFGHWELLYTFLVEDSFLKTRKTWPLK